jgi:hypothetical protein
MARSIYIQADTNDADYISATSDLNEEDLPTILKVVEAIKAFDSRTRRGSGQYNWPSSYHRNGSPHYTYDGILTEEEIDIFSDYVPCGEDGIHTIESVQIFQIIDKEVLL